MGLQPPATAFELRTPINTHGSAILIDAMTVSRFSPAGL
jgi:hypothetical protein